MCDYSLFGVPNRLARDGDELTVHPFLSGTLGLADAHPPSPRKPEPNGGWWRLLTAWMRVPDHAEACAVCIPPGAQLLLRDLPPHLQSRFSVCSTAEVTFTQITSEAYRHRDAVRFSNGQEVLLQDLPCGLGVCVLSVGATVEREFAATLVSRVHY